MTFPWTSLAIGVEDKFWGVRKIFAQISPNLPEKNFKENDSIFSKEKLHIISCWAHLFEASFCPDSPILPEKTSKTGP